MANNPNEKLMANADSGQSFELLRFSTQYAVHTADVPTISCIADEMFKCSNSGGNSNLLQPCPGFESY